VPGQPASMRNAVLSRRSSSGDGILTTHSHAVERLRVSGAVPLLTRYAFLAWTRSVVTGQCFFPSNQQVTRVLSAVTGQCFFPSNQQDTRVLSPGITLPSVQRVCSLFSFRFRLYT
jgi:hypothetical protein